MTREEILAMDPLVARDAFYSSPLSCWHVSDGIDSLQLIQEICNLLLFSSRKRFFEELQEQASVILSGYAAGDRISWPDVLLHLNRDMVIKAALIIDMERTERMKANGENAPPS